MTYDPALTLCRRNSVATSLVVDIACYLLGIRDAAEYMARHGIPFAVAHRVLLHPSQRRRA